MKRLFFPLIAFACTMSTLSAQMIDSIVTYHTKALFATPTKSQDNTGLCWSFATASFLESEVVRQGGQPLDLSEAYYARYTYLLKAVRYIESGGTGRFSQGGLSHDVMFVFKHYGTVPEEVYSGKTDEMQQHDHLELENVLKGLLDGYLKLDKTELTPQLQTAIESVLDIYLGPLPQYFEYNGKYFSPQGYKESLGVDPDDYVSLSSFTHHPFYEPFVLEVPDNWMGGQFYNLPIDELMQVVDYALDKGFTVAWDGDVTEEAFKYQEGIATYTKPNNAGQELQVTQAMRQQAFVDSLTTDDHLMHITGTSTSNEGIKLYYTKNSWGNFTNNYQGYMYLSEAYLRYKTISLFVHKNALPKAIKDKLAGAAPLGVSPVKQKPGQ